MSCNDVVGSWLNLPCVPMKVYGGNRTYQIQIFTILGDFSIFVADVAVTVADVAAMSLFWCRGRIDFYEKIRGDLKFWIMEVAERYEIRRSLAQDIPYSPGRFVKQVPARLVFRSKCRGHSHRAENEVPHGRGRKIIFGNSREIIVSKDSAIRLLIG